MNQQPLLLELAEAKFRETIKQGHERDQQSPRRRVEENKNVDVTGGEWFAMKAGGCRSTQSVV